MSSDTPMTRADEAFRRNPTWENAGRYILELEGEVKRQKAMADELRAILDAS